MEMSRKNSFPGRLFIVEGIDGSGKRTQLTLLHRWLEAAGHATVFCEWNSSPLVKKVTRRGKKKRLLTPMTFSLIHATDFADRTEHQMIPPLKSGAGVGLADDVEATFAYFRAASSKNTNGWSRSLGGSSFTQACRSRSNKPG